MNRSITKSSSSDTETASGSYEGGVHQSAGLGYSHSEFSLGAPGARPIISQQRLPGPTDGGASDEDLSDEVVVSHTRLSLLADQAKQANQASQVLWAKQRRLYVDLDMRVGSVAANVALRGGEEEATRKSVERLMSRAAHQERVVRLQRTAFGCPLSVCQMAVNATNCLAHCLEQHPTVAVLEMRPNLTACLPLGLPLVLGACGSQRCIGMLIFESGRQRGTNVDLAERNEGWTSSLAVMGLLWKTSWDAQLHGPMVTHLYNLWFFCPQAHPPLQVLVSAESQVRAKEVKQLKREVKQQLIPTSADPLLHEQRAMQRENEQYMRFTHREMKLLTNDFTTDIDLKLTIQEEQKTPPKATDLEEGNGSIKSKYTEDPTSSHNLAVAVDDPLQAQSPSNADLDDESVEGTLKIIDSMADELLSGFVDFEKYNLDNDFVKAVKSQALIEKVKSRSVSASVSEAQLAQPSEGLPSLAVLEESQSKSSGKTPSLASVVVLEKVQPPLVDGPLKQQPDGAGLRLQADLQPQQEVTPTQKDLEENVVGELLDELVEEHELSL
ncbi:GL15917 [Drosophila persimilis]|uniref:GL15917 n=1 Tax=Drosophila persimilis TaxID=7234 RepID=B4H147_DROPE|nr:uncharacterized protein LOC6599424 [Drosophila persimilis]EDW29963.1 GL15917 [Drosophila persimilis]